MSKYHSLLLAALLALGGAMFVGCDEGTETTDMDTTTRTPPAGAQDTTGMGTDTTDTTSPTTRPSGTTGTGAGTSGAGGAGGAGSSGTGATGAGTSGAGGTGTTDPGTPR